SRGLTSGGPSSGALCSLHWFIKVAPWQFQISSYQKASRNVHSDARKFHAASAVLALRIRPLYVLLGTGGGYVGYRQYGKYQDIQLERQGIEIPPKIANELE
ncbi:hypothetical protein NDU88_006547, partial [Pleurodeles waltl]